MELILFAFIFIIGFAIGKISNDPIMLTLLLDP